MTARQANFNYMAAQVAPSLYRNGQLRTVRDQQGSDSTFVGMVVDKQLMSLTNGRELSASAACSLSSNGFELIPNGPDRPERDYMDHAQVLNGDYPDCEALVREVTGASTVVAFDHNVRSAKGNKATIRGGQDVQGPARIVHGDYTLTSAPQRLRDLAKPPTSNDTLADVLGDRALLDADQVEQAIDSGRFAIINVWRNLLDEPVQLFPLGLCDGQSVMPDDLTVFEIHYADRIGENYFARHADLHRWYHYPQLTRRESLLIKQWDSQGPMATSKGARADQSDPTKPCTFSFHTAFRDPQAGVDAPDRLSMEVRCAVIY